MPLLSRRPPCSDGRVTSTADRSALASRDAAGLTFTAEMYGLQLDQLAELLSLTDRQARAVVTRWSGRGLADSAVLGPGPAWVWLSRAGPHGLWRSVRGGPARTRTARAHPRGHRHPACDRGGSCLPRRQRALAKRTASARPPGRARTRPPAGRRGALARQRARGLGRRMLGHRGRADAEDRGTHHRDHARAADQDGRLRLSGRAGSRARRAAASRQGDLPVRPGGRQHGRPRTQRLGSLAARIEIRALPAGAQVPT